MQRPYRSQTYTWTPGSKINIALDFLPRQGPLGGRLVIESMHFESNLVLTTGSGVSVSGADIASALDTLGIYDAVGPRVLLSGFMTRQVALKEYGIKAPADPATIAASSTGAARTVNFWMPFQLPDKAERDDDTNFPVDDLLDGGKVEFTPAAMGNIYLTTGATPPTFVSGDVTLNVYCREEDDFEMHSRGVWEMFPQSQSLTYSIPVGGRLLRSADVYLPAANGGSSVSGIGPLTIEAYQISQLTFNSLQQAYLLQQVVDVARDPVFLGKAAPIIYAKRTQKIPELLRFSGNVLVRVPQSTVSTPTLLVYSFAPKDSRMQRSAAKKNGFSGKDKVKVKTNGKSTQLDNPKKWGGYAAFMPAKMSKTAA